MLSGPSGIDGKKPAPTVRLISGAGVPGRLTSAYLAFALGRLLEPFGYQVSAGARQKDMTQELENIHNSPKVTIRKGEWKAVFAAQKHSSLLAVVDADLRRYDEAKLYELESRISDILKQRTDDDDHFICFWYLDAKDELRSKIKTALDELMKPVP